MLTFLTLIGFILRRSILVRGEKTEYVTAKRNHTAKLFVFRNGGEGGIRTPGTGFSPYNGLANRRLQPLGHLSGVYFQQLTTEPSDAPVVKWWLDRREGWKPPS